LAKERLLRAMKDGGPVVVHQEFLAKARNERSVQPARAGSGKCTMIAADGSLLLMMRGGEGVT
jgi:hypothetical protein